MNITNSEFRINGCIAANLDAVTERQIWETLHPLLAERSTLVVTHRLTGLEQMDEILVLQDGRVIERGTHDDLLTEDGFYRRMWVLQQGQSGSL
jgi:ABC-type multidrug transport system fused ATPase/permease subunit